MTKNDNDNGVWDNTGEKMIFTIRDIRLSVTKVYDIGVSFKFSRENDEKCIKEVFIPFIGEEKNNG